MASRLVQAPRRPKTSSGCTSLATGRSFRAPGRGSRTSRSRSRGGRGHGRRVNDLGAGRRRLLRKLHAHPGTLSPCRSLERNKGLLRARARRAPTLPCGCVCASSSDAGPWTGSSPPAWTRPGIRSSGSEPRRSPQQRGVVRCPPLSKPRCAMRTGRRGGALPFRSPAAPSWQRPMNFVCWLGAWRTQLRRPLKESRWQGRSSGTRARRSTPRAARKRCGPRRASRIERSTAQRMQPGTPHEIGRKETGSESPR